MYLWMTHKYTGPIKSIEQIISSKKCWSSAVLKIELSTVLSRRAFKQNFYSQKDIWTRFFHLAQFLSYVEEDDINFRERQFLENLMHTQSVVKLIAKFSCRTNMVCLLAVSSVLHEWPNPPRTPLNFLTNYGFQFVQPQQGNPEADCDIKGHVSYRKHNRLWGHGATRDPVARENSDINYTSLNAHRWTYTHSDFYGPQIPRFRFKMPISPPPLPCTLASPFLIWSCYGIFNENLWNFRKFPVNLPLKIP